MNTGLADLSTGVVWDVLRAMGLPHQALSSAISALEPDMKVCGPAFCIRGQSYLGTPPKPQAGERQPRYEFLKHVVSGCVLAIDSGGYREAVVMGENFALSAMAAGCAGFVLDGATRDTQSLVDQKVPVFKSFVTPASSAGRWAITDFQIPISLPGQTSAAVQVRPGDMILGDRDGVIVIPQEHVHTVTDYARRVDQIERQQRTELLAPNADRQAVYERYDRFAHIVPIRRPTQGERP